MKPIDARASRDDDAPIPQAEGPSEEEIVERIFAAVIEQRLPPGTKLAESDLCRAFGSGRMRVRHSLLLLASREVVELRSNRGAFVATPTAKQARDVFEARLAIEPSVVRHAIARASDADLHALSLHLRKEVEAHRDGRRHDAICLSGHFHVIVAEIAGNAVLLRMVTELIARTSLIIGIFGGPVPASCRHDDHGVILDAFQARDAAAASAHMAAHLEALQTGIDLNDVQDRVVDLVTLFSRA